MCDLFCGEFLVLVPKMIKYLFAIFTCVNDTLHVNNVIFYILLIYQSTFSQKNSWQIFLGVLGLNGVLRSLTVRNKVS